MICCGDMKASGYESGLGAVPSEVPGWSTHATNLVTAVTNAPDRHDRQTGTTIRVSVSSADVQATGLSGDPAISGDG